MNMLMAVVFMLGYICIASEHFIKVNKAATALLTGVICWSLLIFGGAEKHEVNLRLMEHTADIAGIIFFLMGELSHFS